MNRQRVQENLVALFLRLNGYFTTSLIIHSEKDSEVSGEIDIIGVRFPNHKQSDRNVKSDSKLEMPKDKIDIIICEVKGGKSQLKFNDFLNDKKNVIKLLEWVGVVNSENIHSVADKIINAIKVSEVQNCEPFPKIEIGDYCIRLLLFAPDKIKPRNNQRNFISGSDMINFCWKCFRPDNIRETCSTNYKSINNWGEQFEKLVGYFKNHDKSTVGTIKDLYKHFDV